MVNANIRMWNVKIKWNTLVWLILEGNSPSISNKLSRSNRESIHKVEFPTEFEHFQPQVGILPISIEMTPIISEKLIKILIYIIFKYNKKTLDLQ